MTLLSNAVVNLGDAVTLLSDACLYKQSKPYMSWGSLQLLEGESNHALSFSGDVFASLLMQAVNL